MPNTFSRIKSFAKFHPVRAATLAGFFQQACSASSALLLFPFIVSSLSSAESGLWFSFQGFIGIAGLCDFGLGFVVARQTAYSLGQNEGENLDGDFINLGRGGKGVYNLRRHVEKIYKISSLVAIGVGVFIFELILPLTRALEGVQGNVRAVWYLMLASGAFLLLATRWIAILNGAGNVFAARLILGCFFLLQGIFVGLAAVLTGHLLFMAVASLIVAMIYFYAVYRAACITVPELNERKGIVIDPLVVKRLWKIAIPVGCINTSSYLVSSVQVPMLGAIFGPASVAPFYLAQRLLQFGSLVALQPITSQLTRFTGLFSQDRANSAYDVMMKSLRFVIPVSLICGIGFTLLSPFVAGLIAPGKLYPEAAILGLMALNMFILNFTATGAQFVMASGRNPFMWITLLNGFLNVFLLWLLVPKLGLVGIPFSGLLAGSLSSYPFCFSKWNSLRQKLGTNHSAIRCGY